MIREDEGSHTAFNDEVVPGFSDEESPITQASSKGSTKGRKRTPPMPEELCK